MLLIINLFNQYNYQLVLGVVPKQVVLDLDLPEYGVEDKSFDFIIKQPPVAIQLMEVSKVKKGSAEPHLNKVGSVTWEQVKQIAETKMVDLNCFTIESAMKMVAGTARSMGITVKGASPFKN